MSRGTHGGSKGVSYDCDDGLTNSLHEQQGGPSLGELNEAHNDRRVTHQPPPPPPPPLQPLPPHSRHLIDNLATHEKLSVKI
ncbi:hypothetical protein E2C01_021534 [Portunus trituberculatus]|uniref:Uncharacterized protein n=1 Tax=Portunus trituberculatus TaxID=210409 RepID=A0A5B7E4Y2_PORTR|nr:hypothetical protein [Portunus trituberculatus]